MLYLALLDKTRSLITKTRNSEYKQRNQKSYLISIFLIKKSKQSDKNKSQTGKNNYFFYNCLARYHPVCFVH